MGQRFSYKLVFACKRIVEYQVRRPWQMARLGEIHSRFLEAYAMSGLSQGLQRRVFQDRHLRKMVMAGQAVSTAYARKILKIR